MIKPTSKMRAEDLGFRYVEDLSRGETYGQVTLSRLLGDGDKAVLWQRIFPTAEVADDFLDGFELGREARDQQQVAL